MLLKIAIALFIFGALFGLVVLTAILKNKETPKPIVVFHGLFVATGLVLVLITFFRSQTHKLLDLSLGLLLIAALGGFTLLYHDLSKKPIPRLLAILHPIIAAIGLVSLIAYVLPAL